MNPYSLPDLMAYHGGNILAGGRRVVTRTRTITRRKKGRKTRTTTKTSGFYNPIYYPYSYLGNF